MFPRPNTWRTVEIKGFEGHLQVLVDGKMELDVTDSEVVIDDIEMRCRQTCSE